jgi:ribose 5-phosphate isomerase RpiB
MGGRVEHSPEEVKAMIHAWLQTDYEGGRHQKRLEKIAQWEGKE